MAANHISLTRSHHAVLRTIHFGGLSLFFKKRLPFCTYILLHSNNSNSNRQKTNTHRQLQAYTVGHSGTSNIKIEKKNKKKKDEKDEKRKNSCALRLGERVPTVSPYPS